MIAATNDRSKCAVLLAVYNGMQYIEEQITSILEQVGVDVTVFVSIDKSSDGSEIWLNELAMRDSRVVILPVGMVFGGAGRNFFRLIRDVDCSAFDYVAFADQDDHWYPDKLLNAANLLNQTNHDAYSSNVTAFWPDGRELLINRAKPQKRWDFIFQAAGPGCTYVMSCKLMLAIKKRLLEAWDAHQDVSLHDWYCYAFARANGFRWYIAPEPSMLYRQHENNQVGVNKGMRAAIDRLKKIRNGWWLTQALLISRLVGLGDDRFVKSWDTLGRFAMLRLATKAFQCRRDFRDQVIFMGICITFAITGNQNTQ